MIKKGGTNPDPVGPRPPRPQTRPTVAGTIKVKTWDVVTRAVEEGINHGWNRAHKHTSTPSEQVVKENMEREILNSLSEVLNFGD
jgi:hypothetical protein